MTHRKLSGNGFHRAQAVAQIVRTVGFTYNVKTEYALRPDDPEDAAAEFDHPDTVRYIMRAFRAHGFRVVPLGNTCQLLSRLEDLCRVDIVFNIAEGFSGRNRESEVPGLLEALGVPFVGADALCQGMTLDKVMAKKALIADGIRTPRFTVVTDPERIDLNGLDFPLFIKPRCEGSSKGLSTQSLVRTMKQLREQVAWLMQTYREPALVEEFITGSEVTVAILGNGAPEICEVVQIVIDGNPALGERFYSRNFLQPRSGLTYRIRGLPKAMEQRLKDIAWRSYQAVDCRDFGRVDLRIDRRGEPYVLEINPLPSLSVEDVFPLVAKVNGMTFEELLCQILVIGVERCGLLKSARLRSHVALIRRIAQDRLDGVETVLHRPSEPLAVDAHV